MDILLFLDKKVNHFEGSFWVGSLVSCKFGCHLKCDNHVKTDVTTIFLLKLEALQYNVKIFVLKNVHCHV